MMQTATMPSSTAARQIRRAQSSISCCGASGIALTLIGDAQSGIAEDLYWIDDSSPDLEKLARIVGPGSIR
jgi:hypothetical protein